nr:retrovirus-related Pol polyprotein from transposon TNT 1-94 [Tanacetum cinerariifolium]
MALADDEITVGKSHARNGEWVDITIRKVNTLISMDEDADWQNYLKDELLSLKQAKLDVVTFQIQNTKLTKLNHALQEQLKEEKRSMRNEMVPKTKDWVERLNPDSKLPNFNTGRILVHESQVVNESLEILNTPESSKDSEVEFLTPLPPLKNLMGACPSLEILKAKVTPFPPCTHYGFNDHRPDDCRNYPECEIYRSYDHSTLRHNRVIHIRRGVLVESSQSNESLIGVKCNTCGSIVHSTSDHNEFDHFKRVSLISINHKKYTLVIVDEYSWYTWVYFLRKKSQALEMIMSFIRMSHISNQASTSSHPAPQDRWSRDQHIEHVNIIGNPGEGMLTRSIAAKLTAASEELNQFYRNKVWILVPFPYGKIAIGSKWVFRNKKDKHGTTTKNKARLVAQGYSHEEGINYDETFAPVARMEAIRIFFAFATYMNFKVYQMDVKSAFLNGKLKEKVYVKQPPGFQSSEFPDCVCKLDKSLYGLKQHQRHECSGFDLKGYSDSGYVGCNMDRKSTSAEAEYVTAVGCCASILWIKSQLSDYDIHYKMVPIFCGNTSATAIIQQSSTSLTNQAY